MAEPNSNSMGEGSAPKDAAQAGVIRRRIMIGLIGAGVLLGLAFVVSVWYVQTPGFQAWLRNRFANQLERITGGRVEIGALAWNLRTLQFEARNLTIHGLEPADEVPYAHMDRLAVRIKILSLFRREVGLRYIELDRPIIHLIVYPDGSTNQPLPWRPAATGTSPIEQLFAIDVNQAVIHDGWALVNQRSWPLDFSAEHVAFSLSFLGAENKYQGDLRIAKVEVASAGELGLPLKPGSTEPDWIQRPDRGGNAGAAASASISADGLANDQQLKSAGRSSASAERFRLSGSAEARFSLWLDHLHVDSLRISTGHSQLRATGEMQNFNHPVVQAAYSAVLDGAEIGSVLRFPELRTGTVTLNGQARGDASTFASSGKIAVGDLDYMDRDFRVERVSGGAQFTVTNDRLALAHISLGLFGGTTTGDLEVLHWRSPGNAMAPGVQTGTVHLLAHDWLVARVASAVATPALPLERLKAEGAAGGSVGAHWRRSPGNLIAEVALNVVPPANPIPGDLTLKTQLQATYDNATGRLKFDHLSLATPGSQLNATGVVEISSAVHPSGSEAPENRDLFSGTIGVVPEIVARRHGALAPGAGDLRPGARNSRLEVAVSTHNLEEVERVIAVLGGPASLPVALHGQASLQGALTGSVFWPRLTGRLEASDLESLFAAGDGPRRIHWDTLAAEVEFSRRVLAAHHAVLRRGAAQLDVDAAIRLQNDSLTDASPFAVQADLHYVDVEDVLFATGTDAQRAIRNLQFAGKLNAGLSISGTGANPQGHASLMITGAKVYGEPVQRMSANLQFGPAASAYPPAEVVKNSGSYHGKNSTVPLVADRKQGALTHSVHNLRPTADGQRPTASERPTTAFDLTAIQITQNGATITGTAGYNPATTAYHFDLRGNGLNLGKLRWLQTSHVAVSGKMSFAANGSGTKDAPALNADVQLSNLIMNGQPMGAVQAQAVTTGDTLHFTARSSDEQSNWSIDGQARMRGDFPARAGMTCNQVSLEPWLRMVLKNREIGPSVVTGSFVLEGPLRSPRDLMLSANLDHLLLDIERLQLHNDGPVRFTLAQQILHVQQLQVSGTNTALTASGSIQLAGERQVDVEARGQVDLKLLESFDPTTIAHGTLALDLRANGTLTRPLIRGRLDVANAAFSQIDLPNGLSDLNGRLVFNEDRLQIRNLSGTSGGGTVNISGYIAYGHGISCNLNAQGHEIRLRYPPGVSSMAEADLRLTGSPQNALLAGDITVTRFEVNPQFDFASYLAKSRQVAAATSDSLLSRLRMDIHLVSTPELQVQTSLAKVSGDLDLRLRGTEARPVLLGRVNITEGDISFNGTKYHMERGGITFSNPVTIDPVLDIEATTSVRDYDINLGLHGPLDKLSTTYRSDPPLATADIVSLLAFGSVREDLAMQSTSASNLTPEAQTVLSQALNAAVSSRMQKLFGVSRIKIDPQAGGLESNPAGPRLTIEQQVANNITLTYITDVTRANYQTIQAEYNISRNLSVVAIRDWTGLVSFDIRVRQRKR